MAVKFTNGIDLDKTGLANALLDPVGSDPGAPVDGQVWYRTDTDDLYLRANGVSEIVALASDVVLNSDISAVDGFLRKTGAGTYEAIKSNLNASAPPAVGDDNLDGYAIGSIWLDTTNVEAYVCLGAGTGAAVWVNTTTDAGAGSTNLSWTKGTSQVTSDTGGDATLTVADSTDPGLMSSSDFDKLAAITGSNTGDEPAASVTVAGIVELADATETQAGTDATRAITPDALQGVTDVSGMAWVIDEDNLATDSALRVPTQQSVKAYIDAATVNNLIYRGSYNASTNTPDLDVAPSGVLAGDFYTVTVAGTFFTAAVEVGDSIIAETDGATLEADWTIVNKNIDAATSTAPGIVELATSGEVTTGTATDLAVTPEALANSKYGVAKFAADCATTSPWVITHNLGTTDVVVSIKETATSDLVFADVDITGTNSVTITFAANPTSAQFRAVVIG